MLLCIFKVLIFFSEAHSWHYPLVLVGLAFTANGSHSPQHHPMGQAGGWGLLDFAPEAELWPASCNQLGSLLMMLEHSAALCYR